MILLVLLAIRISVLASVISENPAAVIRPDSYGYDNSAKALLETKRYSVSPLKPDIPEVIRTPGYPLFIAGIYFLFGKRHFPVIFAQILLSIATAFILYQMARRIWGSRDISTVCLLLFALDVNSFYHSQLLITETVFAFIIQLWIFWGVVLIQEERLDLGRSFLYGLMLAVGTMIRPISYYLFFLTLFLFLIIWRSKQFSYKRISSASLMMVLPFLVIVGGWQLRNYYKTGSAELSFIKHINVLFYRGAGIIARADKISFEKAQQKLTESFPEKSSMPTKDYYDKMMSRGMKIILSHPFLAVKDQMKGAVNMLMGPGYYIFLEYLGIKTGFLGDIFRLSYGQYMAKWVANGNRVAFVIGYMVSFFSIAYMFILYTGIVVSGFRMVHSKSNFDKSHLFILSVVFYFIIISAGPESTIRFRVPFMPLLCLYSGMGLYRILKPLKPYF